MSNYSQHNPSSGQSSSNYNPSHHGAPSGHLSSNGGNIPVSGMHSVPQNTNNAAVGALQPRPIAPAPMPQQGVAPNAASHGQQQQRQQQRQPAMMNMGNANNGGRPMGGGMPQQQQQQMPTNTTTAAMTGNQNATMLTYEQQKRLQQQYSNQMAAVRTPTKAQQGNINTQQQQPHQYQQQQQQRLQQQQQYQRQQSAGGGAPPSNWSVPNPLGLGGNAGGGGGLGGSSSSGGSQQRFRQPQQQQQPPPPQHQQQQQRNYQHNGMMPQQQQPQQQQQQRVNQQYQQNLQRGGPAPGTAVQQQQQRQQQQPHANPNYQAQYQQQMMQQQQQQQYQRQMQQQQPYRPQPPSTGGAAVPQDMNLEPTPIRVLASNSSSGSRGVGSVGGGGGQGRGKDFSAMASRMGVQPSPKQPQRQQQQQQPPQPPVTNTPIAPVVANQQYPQNMTVQQQQQMRYRQQQQYQQQQRQPQPQSVNAQNPNQVQMRYQQQQSMQQQQQQQQSRKGKVSLSKEAKEALARAIWSAIRSPTGQIDPMLMQQALATGLPQNAILNAARVAREREAKKRAQKQAQAQPNQQINPRHPQQQQQQQPPPNQMRYQPQQQQPQNPQYTPQQQQQRQQDLQRQRQQYEYQQQQARNLERQQIEIQEQRKRLQLQQQQAEQQRRQQQQQQMQGLARMPNDPNKYRVQQQPKSKQVLQFEEQQRQKALYQQQQPVQMQTQNKKKTPKAAQQNGKRTAQAKTKKTASQHQSAAQQKKAQQAAMRKQAEAQKQKVQSQQQAIVQRVLQLRMKERSHWCRAQHGVFVKEGDAMTSTPMTLLGMTRSQSQDPVLSLRDEENKKAGQPSLSVLEEAARIQALLLGQDRSSGSDNDSVSSVKENKQQLLDADQFKRVKLEPKKFGRALDRLSARARKSASDALSKKNKEIGRAISSHQTEFFKFHKARKAEAGKFARQIRDNAIKEAKRQEKEEALREKARLAALKANDMDAYTKLLEDTKNERLRFLMDKTESHFAAISSKVAESRDADEITASGEATSYYASAHSKKEEVRQPSILVGGDLKEYQMGGLQWLVSLYNNRLNGILADEMGLGKTIQAIALISYLMEYKNNLGPFLVIVPLSTLSNWSNEFAKWCPSAHVVNYKGIPAVRRELYKDQVKNGHFNVLLTTYEYIIKDKASLRKTSWQYAIVDEGHRMKNAASKFARTLSTQYETKYRVLLTGTPLMNDLGELWALLNFLLPTIFSSADTFDEWFNKPFSNMNSTSGNTEEDENQMLTNEERMFIIHRLHELLRPFMLRRVKSEVLDQLPEKVEKVLRCDLSSWQKELYKQISRKAVTEVNGEVTQASRGLNNAVMQLRKVCNHPYLFTPEGYNIDQTLIRSSGKFELIDRMLPKLRAAGHRVLLFTQMTTVMTILEDYFVYRGYLSIRLDGSTTAEEREKRMYKFNAPDSPYFIFLLSTRAGGLGLNLTSANTVIIFDSDWNPMMDLQAQDRAHRIGQRSDVSVFRLITNAPVEEKILSRATEKLNMNELVVEAGKFDKRSVESDNSLERKNMLEVLLTDFDNTANTAPSTKGKDSFLSAPSEATSDDLNEDEDDDDDDKSEASKEEDLNDLLSNNENDYQLYKSIDKLPKPDGTPDTSLFTSIADVPDWILNPPRSKKQDPNGEPVITDVPRKRKEVVYDDGLTDKQFVRLMNKQFDQEQAEHEAAKQEKVKARLQAPKTGADSLGMVAASPATTELTDWTFRKLVTCVKTVTLLKEPSTKRKVCEVFMDKPSHEQFPDYYEMIEQPIAINDILRKCRNKMYTTLLEFREDWNLMFANAKQFNGEDSWVVQDGKTIEKELERVLKKNGFVIEHATKETKPKQKKNRIKISLKKKNVDVEAGDGSADADQVTEPSGPPKKKRKK